MDLTEGTTLADRYVLERPLGRGGMGEVWAAKHTRTGRRVALKVLHAEARGTHRERLIREARAAGSLEHANVCEVFDVLEHEGSPILVMPLLRGETLADRLAREGTLAARDAAAILAWVASGVGAAHAAGVVHRDLKPANIFLTDDGGVKVLDFGIAKLDVAEGPDKLTATGSLLGTPLYMSPEQALGESDVDHRSDVWSLGIVLYECLSGVIPTEADNVGQTIKKVLFERLRPVVELAPDTPAALAELVGGMLERRRSKRVADMREVVTTLSAIGGVDCTLPPSPATTPRDSTVPDESFADDATLDTAVHPGAEPSSSHATRALAATESAPTTSRRTGGLAALALLGVATVGALAWRAPAGVRSAELMKTTAPDSARASTEGEHPTPTAPAPVDPWRSEATHPGGPATSASSAAGAVPAVSSLPTSKTSPRNGARAAPTLPAKTNSAAATPAPAPADATTSKREALRDRR